MRQRELAERFAEGATDGKASNAQIRRLVGGQTALVGYGWAVYAVRSPSGTITAYRGWYGYSPATSTQLTRMGISHPADVRVDPDTYRTRQIPDQYVLDCARLADFDVSALD